MLLSDISVKRPVFATVIAIVLVTIGFVSFDRLALREYPKIDPPIVTIDTDYRGAAANIVDCSKPVPFPLSAFIVHPV